MILLCRTTPKDKGQEEKTDGLSVLLVDMREASDDSLTIRPIRTMMNHATTEIFFDDMKVPAENLIGDEGRLSIHPVGYECRTDSDRGRVHR